MKLMKMAVIFSTIGVFCSQASAQSSPALSVSSPLKYEISATEATLASGMGVEFLAGDEILVPLKGNRSYWCSLNQEIDFVGSGHAMMSARMISPFGGSIGVGYPGKTPGFSDSHRNEFSVTAPAAGNYKITMLSNPGVQLSSGVALSDGDRVRGLVNCEETSLYGGFNTNASKVNFLEITNTTGLRLEFRIYLRDFSGQEYEGSITRTVGGESRVDISVHDIVGVNNYGTIRVTHNGPRGSLSAALAEYDAAGSLILRGRSSLQVR